jgi:hypothetical protein
MGHYQCKKENINIDIVFLKAIQFQRRKFVTKNKYEYISEFKYFDKSTSFEVC